MIENMAAGGSTMILPAMQSALNTDIVSLVSGNKILDTKKFFVEN